MEKMFDFSFQTF